MPRKTIEHFLLRFVSSQVSDKRAFGRVFAQLLKMRLIIFHGLLPVLTFRDGRTADRQSVLTNVKQAGAMG